MVNMAFYVAGQLAKNTRLSFSLTGKAAAFVLSLVGIGGIAGGCYITHEVLEYKKALAKTQSLENEVSTRKDLAAHIGSPDRISEDANLNAENGAYDGDSEGAIL